MSDVKLRGRRRASSPASHATVTAPGGRREALAMERANSISTISVAARLRTGAASGAGQKVGVAMAATGLLLAVTLPTAQGVNTADMEPVAATSVETVVSAGAEIPITFATPEVASHLNPDGHLKETLKVKAANVTRQAAKGTLSAPLKTMEMSSPFGGRINPLTGQMGEQHTGQDFAIACGNQVLAAAGGVVTFAGWHSYGGGNRVVVDHGNGLSTSYNHMSEISVKVGQTVARAAQVGVSGTTGASTGCHLHFEVIVDDATVDPIDWL